jgi:hypothetical protein
MAWAYVQPATVKAGAVCGSLTSGFGCAPGWIHGAAYRYRLATRSEKMDEEKKGIAALPDVPAEIQAKSTLAKAAATLGDAAHTVAEKAAGA